MKKSLALCAVLVSLSAHASYPSWVDMSNYVQNALSGFSPTGGVAGISSPAGFTNSPNLYWTNNVFSSFWATNANFSIGQTGLASSNSFVSRIIISNASASTIQASLPVVAYSLSQATNVNAATISPGTELELTFMLYTNGAYAVIDYGPNSPVLLSLAAAVQSANGLLTASGGTVGSTITPSVFSLAAANGVYADYYNNFPGHQAGIQLQSFDAFGNIQVYFWNRNGVCGMYVTNATLDLVDYVQAGDSGAVLNSRFEHRTPNLMWAGNLSGEMQMLLSSVAAEVVGTNATLFGEPIYAPAVVTTNLVSQSQYNSGGFITNGLVVFCSRTNFTMSTNYIYFAMLTNQPGALYVSSNTAASSQTWLRK